MGERVERGGRGVIGTPASVAKSDRSVGTLRTHCLQLASEVGAVLWDGVLNLRGPTLTPGS